MKMKRSRKKRKLSFRGHIPSVGKFLSQRIKMASKEKQVVKMRKKSREAILKQEMVAR
jgi:hypothetical protein